MTLPRQPPAGRDYLGTQGYIQGDSISGFPAFLASNKCIGTPTRREIFCNKTLPPNGGTPNAIEYSLSAGQGRAETAGASHPEPTRYARLGAETAGDRAVIRCTGIIITSVTCRDRCFEGADAAAPPRFQLRRGRDRLAARQPPDAIQPLDPGQPVRDQDDASVPAATSFSVARKARSVSASRPAHGSSRIRIGAGDSSARASASRRPWPPENRAPPSPTQVSSPSGSARTTSPICAASSAAHSAASSASGRASSRLARIVSSNRCVACASQPIRARTSAAVRSAMSMPPSAMRP